MLASALEPVSARRLRVGDSAAITMNSLVLTLIGPLAAWLVATLLASLASVEELCVSAVRLCFTPFRAVLQYVERLQPPLPPPPPPPAAVEIDLPGGLRVPEGAVPPPGAVPPTATPLPGFLVASVAAPSLAGPSNGDAADQSSDSSSDDDVVADLSSCSFRDGRKIVRDSSFRKRDAAKLERARAFKAHSSCLSSHLVTPWPAHRSIDHSAVSALRRADADGKVAPHSVTITPRKAEIAERGPLTECAYPPALRIPPHESVTEEPLVADAAAAPLSSGAAPAPAPPAPARAAAPKPGEGQIKRLAMGGKAKNQLDGFSVLAQAGTARPG